MQMQHSAAAKFPPLWISLPRAGCAVHELGQICGKNRALFVTFPKL
jgi:hypothetical protein